MGWGGVPGVQPGLDWESKWGIFIEMGFLDWLVDGKFGRILDVLRDSYGLQMINDD